jgi:hypothetical protein
MTLLLVQQARWLRFVWLRPYRSRLKYTPPCRPPQEARAPMPEPVHEVECERRERASARRLAERLYPGRPVA